MTSALRTPVLLFLAACASVARPPGGPVDTAPPEVTSASIDTNAVGVKAGKLDLHFNEVIAERPAGVGGANGPITLESIVLLSPRTGTAKVSWHRDGITIEPRGGFRPNTTYRITILPGIADLRGNVSKATRTYVFSTGEKIQPYAILGRVFDWDQATIASRAIVEAVAGVATPDSLVYVAATDSLGQFDLGPLGPGQYLVRTFIDVDGNRDRGILEKWDTLTVTVTDHRPAIELLAAQRDSAPVGVQGAEALDSVWIRIELDKPFDPRLRLASTMVGVKRTDSSVVQVEALMTEEGAQVLRQRPDTAPARPPAAPPAAIQNPPSTRPPEARPSLPSPQKVLYARVNRLTPLRAGERYVLTLYAIPNLVGRVRSSVAVFDGPKPPARPPE